MAAGDVAEGGVTDGLVAALMVGVAAGVGPDVIVALGAEAGAAVEVGPCAILAVGVSIGVAVTIEPQPPRSRGEQS